MQKGLVLCCQRKSLNLHCSRWLLSLPYEVLWVAWTGLIYILGIPFACHEVQVRIIWPSCVANWNQISHALSLWRARGSQIPIFLCDTSGCCSMCWCPWLWVHGGSSFPFPVCTSWARSSVSLAPATSASALILSCVHTEWLLVCPKSHPQNQLLWVFSLAGFIQWGYYFAWDTWDRDTCTSASHIHWALPGSTRLYQHTAKTVFMSPLMDVEPHGCAQTPIFPWRNPCSDSVSKSQKDTQNSQTVP